MPLPLKLIRRSINRRPATSIAGSLFLMCASLWIMADRIIGQPTFPSHVPIYLYDLDAGQLIVGSSDQLPPVMVPAADGQLHTAVRAYVFACGNCSDPGQQFVGYLESYTPEARFAIENPETLPDPALEAEQAVSASEDGHLIRPVDKDEWVPIYSDQGMQLIASVNERCSPDAYAMPCLPDHAPPTR